jgi:ankyrin repeat protein
MAFLQNPKIADKKVQFIVETQLLLRPYLEGRQAMHLIYKVCRADNPEALWNDFRSNGNIEMRSYDAVQEDALNELNLNMNHDDHRGTTRLWTAAEQGHVLVVQKILQQPSIDPNQVRTKTQTTPLFIAAYRGHQQVMVNSGSISTGMSPLNEAVQHGREEVVEVLLRAKDIDVNQTVMSAGERVSPLIKACEMGHEHIVKLLLASSDINVNFALRNGSTALSIATHRGQDKIKKMLLAHPQIDSSTANVQPQRSAAGEDQGMDEQADQIKGLVGQVASLQKALETVTSLPSQQDASPNTIRGPVVVESEVARLPSAATIPELDVERAEGISQCAPRVSTARKLSQLMSSVRSRERETDDMDQAGLF